VGPQNRQGFQKIQSLKPFFYAIKTQSFSEKQCKIGNKQEKYQQLDLKFNKCENATKFGGV